MSPPSLTSQETKAERGIWAKPPEDNLGKTGVTSCADLSPQTMRRAFGRSRPWSLLRGSSPRPLSDLDPLAGSLCPSFLIHPGQRWGDGGASPGSQGAPRPRAPLPQAPLVAGTGAARAWGAEHGAGEQGSPRGAQAGARGGPGGLIPYVNGSQWRVVLRGAGIRAGANDWQSYWDYRTKSLPALPLSAPLPAPRPALRRSPRRGWGPPSASPPAGREPPPRPPPRPASRARPPQPRAPAPILPD